jgi:hypothetical protein
MARQTITFVLDTTRHRDILQWLDAQDNKSAAIREAIRAHLERDGITLTDVYEAILDLQRQSLVAVSDVQLDGVANNEEPPDVAAALDNLGL